VSVNPDDPELLNPNHFLIGAAHFNQVFASADDEEVPLKKKFKFVKMLADHFWKRWMKECVPNLIERCKWLREQRNIQTGDMAGGSRQHDQSTGRYPLRSRQKYNGDPAPEPRPGLGLPQELQHADRLLRQLMRGPRVVIL
jgi:hypothetical protein